MLLAISIFVVAIAVDAVVTCVDWTSAILLSASQFLVCFMLVDALAISYSGSDGSCSIVVVRIDLLAAVQKYFSGSGSSCYLCYIAVASQL